MTPEVAPVEIGVLFDYPQADDAFIRALRLGIDEAGGGPGRDVELVPLSVSGLPYGSEHAVVQGYDELVDRGVLGVVGPSISDNALVVRDLSTATQVPTINWSGGERTRGPWMFHYQVGSLEEEPLLLAERMRERGLQRASAIYDHSPVGKGYLASFEAACERFGLEITAAVALAPTASNAHATIDRCRSPAPDVLLYFGLGAASHAVAEALTKARWDVPVLANSALMFGYLRRDWRDGWAGWEYVDAVADDNPVRAALASREPKVAKGPIGCAAFDMGRLVATGLARAEHLTRAGFADGLRRVKRLPAATGAPGTTLGFGTYDHAALSGNYLVLREWRDGRSTEVNR